MSDLKGTQKSAETQIRKLVEELMDFRSQRSILNAEIRTLQKEEKEVEIDIMNLLKENGGHTIELDRKVGDFQFVGITLRTGGGYTIDHWEKEVIGLAKTKKHAQEKGLF